MPESCNVIGCRWPVFSDGVCEVHAKGGTLRSGAPPGPRAEDWGKRRAHPAYTGWKNLVRHHGTSIPTRWKDDFWAFISDVPPRPEGRVSICRPDQNKPWGVENFYWRVSSVDPEIKFKHKEYQRDYQRKLRAANPRYGKDQFLRRNYGVTLEWYDAQHARQKGLCTICDQPETQVIGGRLLELAVDHCHEKGHVRSLLCCKCNQGLGCFQDDPELLRKAAAYLDPHKQGAEDLV